MSRRRVSKPRSRADWLLPYAERYIDLVIERKWQSERLHPRDVKKLDRDIEDALLDFEAARCREERIEAERAASAEQRQEIDPKPERATRKLLRASSVDHPWNRRAVLPKK